MDQTFDGIVKTLEQENYLLLPSSCTAETNKIINTFKNNDKYQILLINSIKFGTGLNLQFVTDIILFHQLDMYLRSQVIGRAQRHCKHRSS